MNKRYKLLSLLLCAGIVTSTFPSSGTGATSDSIAFYNSKKIILEMKNYDEAYDTNHDGIVNVFDVIRENKEVFQEESYTDLKSKIYSLETQIELLTQKLAEKEDKTQVESDLSEINSKLSGKVEQQDGKRLSSNDYTDEEKNKLDSLKNYNDGDIKSEISCINSELSSINDAVSGKVDQQEGKQLSSNDFTDSDKEKLENLENYDDTKMNEKINSLVQTAYDEKNQIESSIQNKVDKEEGKQLSSNDYTDREKQKLDGLCNYDDTGIKQEINDLKDFNNEVVSSSGKTGINKFDKSNISSDKYIEPSTGNLAYNSGYFTTDYIDVGAFSKGCYILGAWSSIGMYAFYDDSKTFINGDTILMSYNVNLPSNAKYIRVSCKIIDIDTLMVADSDAEVGYEKYSIITDKIISKESISDYANPVVIKVKKDETGDFVKVHEALDFARKLVNTKDITVEIYPGEYNVFEDMGVEYISSHSSGMVAPDNTTIVGIGNRNDIVIKGYCDDSFPETLKDQISTLMVPATNNFKLKNLTITAQNCRYAIHNDSGESSCDYVQEYEDLKIIYYGTNTNWFGACFGTGYHSGCDVTVKNCKLIAYGKSIPYGFHTNTNYAKPFHVRYLNNEIITPDLDLNDSDCSRVTFNCLNSGMLNFVEYTGNKQECPIEFSNGSGSSMFDIEVYGHSNSSGFEIRNNSGIADVGCRFSDRN